MELIWAKIKTEVRKKNETFNLSDVEALFKTEVASVNRDDWKTSVDHTIAVEKEYWETDGVMEQEVPPMLIWVGDSDSDDENSEMSDSGE